MLKSVTRFVTTTLLVAITAISSLGGVEDKSLRILFPVGDERLDSTFRHNSSALTSATDLLKSMAIDSCRLLKATISGSASPEGPENLNSRLTLNRARVVKRYLAQKANVADSLLRIENEPNCWLRLREVVCNDSMIYNHSRMIAIIDTLADESLSYSLRQAAYKRLTLLDGGLQMRYLLNEVYPLLRSAVIKFERINPVTDNSNDTVSANFTAEKVGQPGTDITESSDALATPAEVLTETGHTGIATSSAKPFYMSVRTNMLYDAALVPNIGADIYLGHNFSLSAMWNYSWWSTNSRHRFWRTYGGDITLRRWVGSAAKKKPLTGHHIGLYLQASTFDFEVGGKGYMGGEPGGSLWDKLNWSAGVEYGFSLPIAKRLNIDFTIAVGYTDCTYHIYRPEDDCYVKESTKHLRAILPAKAEVSIVWLLGRGNTNSRKGGEK